MNKQSNNNNLNKYLEVLEQAPGAVYIIDKNLHFEYINPYFTKLTGYKKEELLNKSIVDTLYKGKMPDSRKELSESLIRGERWQGELLTYHKSGKTYWANTIASPYKDNDGNIEGYIIIQQDITEQKNIENALTESEKLYRTLIESTLEGVAITQNSKIILFNQSFCNLFGYSRDEMSMKKPEDIIAPEDKERVFDLHFKRMRGEISDLVYKANFVRKNGSVFIAEMNASTVQIGGENASFVTMRDITERVAMEEALRESEAKYKTLVENSQDGITIILDNKILYANDTYCKMLGYTRDELYNMPSVNTLHPSEHSKAFAIADRRRNRDFSTINQVFLMVTKEGQIKECETSSTLIQYNGIWASFFTSHDITESKRMQEALQKSEEKYRTLIDNATDGIVITQDGLLKFANNSMCEMMQYTYDEMYDTSFYNYVLKDEHQIMIDYHKRRMAGEDFSSLYRSHFVRKDGKILTVELNARTSDYNGRPAAFIIIRDISERESMEKALRESEEKYRELVETTNSIILKWDSNFNITFINEYGLNFFGYTKEEVFTKPMVGTIVPESEATTKRNLSKLMEAIVENPEKYAQNINENMRKNGERVWVSWNNTAIKDDDGKIVIMFSVGTDITERRRNEEELRIAKTELEKLNHDLEDRIIESSKKLTEVNTQLINLQKENLQSQFDVLKQQVNPHFLFNSLNVLTSLIKLEPDLAEKFSEQLSVVYRYVLENKDNELVSLKTELDFLKAYIFLLDIRFIDKLKVEIDIPDKMLEMRIIPLAMQLLIENAIKHNTMSKSAPLKIRIFIDNENNLNIINNLQERKSQIVSTGVGLQNIKNRYKLLNYKEPQFGKDGDEFVAKVPLI